MKISLFPMVFSRASAEVFSSTPRLQGEGSLVFEMDNLVIEEQVKGLSFVDDRLRQRYELCLIGMQQKDYSQSFPNMIKDTYALKGFYRFINNT